MSAREFLRQRMMDARRFHRVCRRHAPEGIRIALGILGAVIQLAAHHVVAPRWVAGVWAVKRHESGQWFFEAAGIVMCSVERPVRLGECFYILSSDHLTLYVAPVYRRVEWSAPLYQEEQRR